MHTAFPSVKIHHLRADQNNNGVILKMLEALHYLIACHAVYFDSDHETDEVIKHLLEVLDGRNDYWKPGI